jgi:hypothetical protein
MVEASESVGVSRAHDIGQSSFDLDVSHLSILKDLSREFEPFFVGEIGLEWRRDLKCERLEDLPERCARLSKLLDISGEYLISSFPAKFPILVHYVPRLSQVIAEGL